MTFRQWLCKVLCDGAGSDERATTPVEVREASHRLNNEVTALRGHINRLTSSADALTDLVRHMEGKP